MAGDAFIQSLFEPLADVPIVHLPFFMHVGSVQVPFFMHLAVVHVTDALPLWYLVCALLPPDALALAEIPRNTLRTKRRRNCCMVVEKNGG